MLLIMKIIFNVGLTIVFKVFSNCGYRRPGIRYELKIRYIINDNSAWRLGFQYMRLLNAGQQWYNKLLQEVFVSLLF